MRIRLLIFLLLGVFLLGFLGYQYIRFHDGRLHVVFCNVGQGDGIFIRTPNGSDILIDAGPNDSIISCLSKYMPLWDRDIELAFATHPDADHIGGFQYVFKSYKVNQFNTVEKTRNTKVFEEIALLIREKKIPLRYVYTGDTYKTADKVIIKQYWPSREYSKNKSEDANSFSLVQIVSYGTFDLLLTGDIDKERLDKLFPRGLKIEVFKLSHHGSKTGTDEKTLELIQTKLAIISAGFKNRYNHPHPSVLALLNKYNIPIKRTDISSDIELVSDGRRIVFAAHSP